MKQTLIVVLTAFILLTSCNESVVNNNILPSNIKPMWPQIGFNGSQSGNITSVTNQNPVQNGTIDWTYNFGPGVYTDGSEFCADSKGNFYYLSENTPFAALYKFSQTGSLIWKKDSLQVDNFGAISINKSEDRIYFSAYYQGGFPHFFCVDSSGNIKWKIDNCDLIKPVIRSDGNIYTFISDKLTCVSPEGNIIWTGNGVYTMVNKLALDNSDNSYFCNNNTISKNDKSGNFVWNYALADYSEGVTIDGYGNIYTVDDTGFLYCITSDGKLKWKKANFNTSAVPVITKDNKIIVCSDSIKYLDTAGTVIKSFKPFKSISSIYPERVIMDDAENLYYIGGNSNLYAESMDKAGNIRWSVNTGLFGILPYPVLLSSGKMVVAQKRSSKIVCIK